MALTDAQHRRAPNATMHFIDAKVKVQSNHTMPWLNSLSATQQNSAVTYALHAAPAINRDKLLRAKEVDIEVIKRMTERGRKKDNIERK